MLSHFLILPIILILSSLYDICDIIKNKKSREIKIKSGVKIVNMNKNMMKKVILVLSLIALFSIVLGGCTIIGFVTISTNGTVYITIDENFEKLIEVLLTYDILMDDDYVGTISSNETLKLTEVSLGYHTFEAWSTSGLYYGIVENRWIHSGTNNVTITVHPYTY